METSHAAQFPDPEDVLQHLDWVRRLAVRLVGDPAEADDLRQEVWLLSQRLQRPGRIPLKGWLGGLLRNTVRDRRRAANTRVLHEEASALERATAVEQSAAVREVSLHQVVVERLMGLREPYRSTLLARYFENLSAPEIAEREGVTVAAVRSRLQRGLAELRSDLGTGTKRQPSVLALLALGTWEPDAYAGAGAATGAWVIPVTGVLLVGAGALAYGWRDRPVQGPAPPATDTVMTADGRGAADIQPDPAQSVERVAANTPSTVEDQEESAHSQLTIRVIDLSGDPVPGVQLAFFRRLASGELAMEDSTRADDRGLASLARTRGQGIIACTSQRHAQVAFPEAGDAAGIAPLTVVLAPAETLQGRVRTPDRTPIEGALVDVSLAAPLPEPVARFADRSYLPEMSAVTDSRGRFAIRIPVCGVPMGAAVRMVGFEDWVGAGSVVEAADGALLVTMEPLSDPRVCHGRVVSGNGTPIVGAWIGDGERVVRSDAAGQFQLGPLPAGSTLWAGADGVAPVQVEPRDDMRGIEVLLDQPTRSIEGRVRRADGGSAAGLELRLIGGRGIGRFTYKHGGRTAFANMTIESFGRPHGGPHPSTVAATTGPDGSFSIEGILPRDYRLEISDPVSLQVLTGVAVTAGTRGLDIEFPRSPGPVSGRVLNPAGEPIPGALVRTITGGSPPREGPNARADGAGSFGFEHLAPGTRLLADVEWPWVHVGAVLRDGGQSNLTVEAAARVILQVDVAARTGSGERTPTVVRFRDRAGASVAFVVDDVLRRRARDLALEPGLDGVAHAPAVVLPLRATELVLADAAGPIVAVPIELTAGGQLQLSE